jgi:phosphatidylglycerophosphate synthase
MNARKVSYYVINGITMYRLASAPFLLLIAFTGALGLLKWLVAFSFLTDAIDGPLSRRYKVTSVFGSRLDSVADDATVLASTLALWIIYPDFIRSEWVVLVGLLALFGIQMIAALVAYKKVTSFHTYLAKTAAVAQAVFFMMIFFDVGPVHFSFYVASLITALQLLEEILLVILLPEWKADVKGLYWALRLRGEINKSN